MWQSDYIYNRSIYRVYRTQIVPLCCTLLLILALRHLYCAGATLVSLAWLRLLLLWCQGEKSVEAFAQFRLIVWPLQSYLLDRERERESERDREGSVHYRCTNERLHRVFGELCSACCCCFFSCCHMSLVGWKTSSPAPVRSPSSLLLSAIEFWGK